MSGDALTLQRFSKSIWHDRWGDPPHFIRMLCTFDPLESVQTYVCKFVLVVYLCGTLVMKRWLSNALRTVRVFFYANGCPPASKAGCS